MPILFAAARTEDSDIVRGLGLGADDYLLKPLKGTILIAHLRAQLSVHMRIKAEQLNKSMPEEGITIGDLIIRPKARQVILNDKNVLLTGKEFDLLYFLATHPNEVFSKEQLFEQIWSLDPIGEPATVTVHINRLRSKLKRYPAVLTNGLKLFGAPATGFMEIDSFEWAMPSDEELYTIA